MLKKGFTGSRNKPSEAQLDWLWNYGYNGCDEWHHGACVGSDEASHHGALDNGITGYNLIVHPPVKDVLRMKYDPRALWLPAKNYHDRNRDIVDSTDELVALPDGEEREGSGTWMTVRYAVKIGKPVTICYPDRIVEHR